MKKCVACQRKSSLYDKVRTFFVPKREELNKMAESNKMKDMPVNKHYRQTPHSRSKAHDLIIIIC